MTDQSNGPRLAPPGAGLPRIEAWVSRHIVFPLASRLISWDGAAALFQKEGARLLALAELLPADVLQRPVLIRRVTGIEDSSRNWSPAMVLEHLMITGWGMADLTVALSHGRQPEMVVSTAAVKPAGGRGEGIVAEYRAFLGEFARKIAGETGDRASRTRHVHPWFGAITARQWHALAAMHQRIHRKQMERIVAGG